MFNVVGKITKYAFVSTRILSSDITPTLGKNTCLETIEDISYSVQMHDRTAKKNPSRVNVLFDSRVSILFALLLHNSLLKIAVVHVTYSCIVLNRFRVTKIF